jgi:PIN domain nuclease of toxin-antitoxin system
LRADVDEVVRASLDVGFEELVITLAHTVRVRSLPPHHRDPFDRVLVAQAMEEGLTVVTRDPMLAKYDIATLWK